MTTKAVGKAPAGATDLARFGDLRLPFRNRIINGNFAVNQRGVPSTSQIYTAGTYVMDRWKASSFGLAMSYVTAANGDVTVTITSGTLVQVIEGSLYLPEGGAYVLSWAGTAPARVYQGAASGTFVASPIVVTGLAAGQDATVEFGGGTVALAQLEPGSVATPFERRDDEFRRCARYYRTSYSGVAPGTAGAATHLTRFIDPPSNYPTIANVSFDVPMRVSPTVVLYSTKTGTSGKAYAVNLDVDVPVAAPAITSLGFSVAVQNTSTQYDVRTAFTASAEM